MRLLVVTIKSWHIEKALEKQLHDVDNEWHIITSKDDFTPEAVEKINPDYIFLPHWSWLIPETICEKYETVVFHPTDLPFGRGGTPIQNQIARGIYSVQLTALRASAQIDAGDIYMKVPFDLSYGNVEEILKRAGEIYFEKMIPRIISERPKPKPQEGVVTQFVRRKPEQSNLQGAEEIKSDRALYDLVRMLDGEGYPGAYIPVANGRLLFKNASLENNACKMDIVFESMENDE